MDDSITTTAAAAATAGAATKPTKRRGPKDQPSKREYKLFRNSRKSKLHFTMTKALLGVTRLSPEQRSSVAFFLTPLGREERGNGGNGGGGRPR